MAFCPSNCVDDDLVPNAPGGCELKTRTRNLARLMFYPCSLDLPAPLTCDNIEPLVAANSIAFSSELVNVEFSDPTTEEELISDCRPARIVTTGRSISFQDRIAIETEAVASPSAAANKFYDYDFWKDKVTKSLTTRVAFVYCDGSIVIPKDDNGNPMESTLQAFLSQERQGSGGTSYILEIKKGILNFKGDPIFFVKPELTAGDEIFNVNDCEIGV